MPAVAKCFSESGKRSSNASQPKKPPNKPISEPWLLCVVAKEPCGSNSITMSFICSSIKSRQILAIRSEAAQCELEGPLITGPITSLNILG